MERTKEPTAHRQGNLVRVLDAVHKMIDLLFSKDLVKFYDKPINEDLGIDVTYNSEIIDKLKNVAHNLRSFDITEYGDLYLTSGGRIVLDKGYGEYFNDGDTKICSLEELGSGIHLETFQKLLDEKIQERRKKQNEY